MGDYLPDLARVACSGSLPGSERWVNVFHVIRETPTGAQFTSAEASTIASDFLTFYSAIDSVLSTEWDIDEIIVRDQQEIGAPAYNVTITPESGDVNDADLPNQVALVVSWLTNLTGRRHRGRTYLAGFTETSSVQSSPFGAGIDTTARTTIGTACGNLLAELSGDGFPLVVFSRVATSAEEVTRARIGVTWDTQRRRRNKLGEAYATFLPPP